MYCYIVIVAKSRGFAVRLTDFWVVSRAYDGISWDLAKSSNQFLTLDLFVNFISGRSISASFENIIFKIFWGSMPLDPPETGLKNFSRRCAARIFSEPGISL